VAHLVREDLLEAAVRDDVFIDDEIDEGIGHEALAVVFAQPESGARKPTVLDCEIQPGRNRRDAGAPLRELVECEHCRGEASRASCCSLSKSGPLVTRVTTGAG
jgi:hypothetical protein